MPSNVGLSPLKVRCAYFEVWFDRAGAGDWHADLFLITASGNALYIDQTAAPYRDVALRFLAGNGQSQNSQLSLYLTPTQVHEVLDAVQVYAQTHAAAHEVLSVRMDLVSVPTTMHWSKAPSNAPVASLVQPFPAYTQDSGIEWVQVNSEPQDLLSIIPTF
jgi:hypothetical protein